MNIRRSPLFILLLLFPVGYPLLRRHTPNISLCFLPVHPSNEAADLVKYDTVSTQKMDCCGDLSSSEILHDFAPRIRVYKDGRVERLLQDNVVSPSFDQSTRVRSKDVSISPTVSVRLYLPEEVNPDGKKLPLVIYFHGGAFCLYSAASAIYHNYLNALSAAANAVIVSVEYRLAPETPMPACYDDSFVAAQWAASGSDPWLARWADLPRGIVLAGDSAGANIAHDVLSRLGPGVRVAGLAMVHPFFGDDEPNELWNYLYPGTAGVYDPKLNPAADPARMRKGVMGCRRVLVCVGGKDFLKDRGVKYYEVLKEGEIKGSWDGQVEYYESIGRGHVFHLYKPNCEEAKELLKRVASFVNKAV